MIDVERSIEDRTLSIVVPVRTFAAIHARIVRSRVSPRGRANAMEIQPKPTDEHEWLAQIVGEWTYRSESTMPDGTVYVAEGRESVRRFGEYWVIAEGEWEKPDGGVDRSITTLGFDPATGRFVGSFIGTMMTHFWIYDGELDEGRTTLSLHSDGPAMDGSGGVQRYKDVIGLNGEERTMTAWMLADDTWQQFMAMRYSRV
jgi:hypothetical protein